MFTGELPLLKDESMFFSPSQTLLPQCMGDTNPYRDCSYSLFYQLRQEPLCNGSGGLLERFLARYLLGEIHLNNNLPVNGLSLQSAGVVQHPELHLPRLLKQVTTECDPQ